MTMTTDRAPGPDSTAPGAADPGRPADPGDPGGPTTSTASPERDERHAWSMGSRWHVAFSVAMAAMVALALVTGPEEWRWLTAALMCAVVAVYLFGARPLISPEKGFLDTTRALVLMALFLLPTVPAVILNPVLVFALIAIAPVCFMTVGSVLAVSTVGVILVVPTLWGGLVGEQDWPSVGVHLLVNGAVLGYALWFGTWVERIVVQSAERYQLIEALRRSREEVALLSEEAGALAEREHLAREMHDTLAQGFTSIITLTQAVESELDSDPVTARRHLALMRETAAENLAETRAMVAARQSFRLDDEGLDSSVRRIGERLGRELGISVDAEVTGVPEDLPNDLQICLLRTAQEALANVRKHAGARNARVVLAYTDVGVRLTVADDGLGFDPARPAHGNGLANMRHRAASVGGLLDMESSPGGGTTVRLFIPHDDADE
ncbi:sensor histidine kinase [Nocardiopsis sp. NPDC007018]|uniref:sensor histidine kinase n=1 Tax=Nocardiopsis sp. NPDC007018 TaxID=3155721 RepID=UPI0033E7DD80